MQVIFTRKMQTQDLSNGIRVGGKSDDAVPTYIDTIKHDNVISITETTAGGIPVYEVVIPDNPNPLRYGVNTYNMMCTGG